MEMIDEPDRIETSLIRCVRNACHSLICFNRVFDPHQVHGPALGKRYAKLQSHKTRPLLFVFVIPVEYPKTKFLPHRHEKMREFHLFICVEGFLTLHAPFYDAATSFAKSM